MKIIKKTVWVLKNFTGKEISRHETIKEAEDAINDYLNKASDKKVKLYTYYYIEKGR